MAGLPPKVYQSYTLPQPETGTLRKSLNYKEYDIVMAPRVAIVFYSLYGHLQKLAEAEQIGLQKVGIKADIFQIAETLPADVLVKMRAGPKSEYPIAEATALEQYDAFLFGIPTRFGNFPAQWKAFWDATSHQWSSGGYWGKYAGLFIGTATQGGGQETTAIAAMSTLVHHGMVYVPLGYKTTFDLQSGLSEARGGSPWGAGTYSGIDGSRLPSQLELDMAVTQGESFGKTISKVTFA
ncbi:Minor allergen Alt a 7 [Exophiala bonariae]|uniref:Minor allergen Alt a 7 n=1 Tax=Exophiala bonariae TaxID=1690606 RepID=A0AAV9MZE2_9EURO|nr:Minor allergen Alt a 7 [Exophiala bonariae]